MFKGFFNKILKNKKSDNDGKSILDEIFHEHTQAFLSIPRFASLSDEFRNDLINSLYANFKNIELSTNPIMDLRELIASYVIQHAELQILCLNEIEKKEASYKDNPYISGALYKNIRQASDYVDDLKDLKWKYPNISDDELISFCNSRCVVLQYFINGLNRLRIVYKDYDMTKDWLLPFMTAMLIWEEDKIRKKIGLESLLLDGLDSLKYSTFLNFVINGEVNPYYKWEKAYGSLSSEQSLTL